MAEDSYDNTRRHSDNESNESGSESDEEEIPDIISAIQNGDENKVKSFLNGAIDVNEKKDGNTLMHIAVKWGRREIVSLLLENKADANIKNKDGHTPLYLVFKENRKEIAELLLEKNEDGILKWDIDETNKKKVLQRYNKKLNEPNWQSIKELLEQTQPWPSVKKRSPNITDTHPKRIKTTDLKRKDLDGINSNTHKRQRTDPSLDPSPSYAASGVKRALDGTIYQSKLLMLIVKRAIDKNYDFRLATEMDAAEKFDDAVIKYQDQGKWTYRFIQAKHKQNPQRDKITVNDLKTEQNGNFSLQKYFISFCKIKGNKVFERDNLKDFIIATNTDFDFNINRQFNKDGQESKHSKERNELIKKWKNFFKIERLSNADQILYFGKGEMTAQIKKDTQTATAIEKEIESVIKKNIEDIQKQLQTRKNQALSTELNSLRDILGNNFSINIRDFIERLTFITNYPNETELGDFIKSELGEEFYLLNADLVSDSFEKEMLDFLKSYEKGKAYFYSWKDGITSGLSKAYSEKLRVYGIHFNNNLKALERFLCSTNYKHILHVSTASTRLSAIKILQSLDSSELQNKHNYLKAQDGYIFMRLSDLFIEKIQKIVIDSAFSVEKTHQLLVIECQTKTQENEVDVEKLYTQLSGALSNSSKKIILVTPRDDTLASKLRSSYHDEYQRVDDENYFKDLSEDSKDHLLKKMVNFQGIDIVLNHIIDKNSASDIIDEASLSRLIQEEKYQIGDTKSFSSIGYIRDYYIERTLHRQRIKPKVLKEKMNDVLFFVTGANEEDLTRLKTRKDNLHIWVYGQTNNMGIILPPSGRSAEEIFENLGKEQPGKNIHWLDYQVGNLFWKAFKGNSLALNEYIDDNYVPGEEDIRLGKNGLKENYFNQLEAFGQKVVIIANNSGAGKSTVLPSIAQKMKEENPTLWVVRINLNDYAEEGKEYSLGKINFQENDVSKAIEFVSGMAVSGDRGDTNIKLQRKLFKARLKGAGNIDGQDPKIVIQFDGFDEISPNFKPNTTKLIKALKKSNYSQLWVTTRVHEKADLERELESPSYILNPLTSEEQKEFLAKFWRWSLKFCQDPYNQEIREKTYEEILKHLNKINASDKLFCKLTVISNILNDYNLGLNSTSEQSEYIRGAVDKLDFSFKAEELLERWKVSIGDSEHAFTNMPLHLRMLSEVVLEKKFQLPKDLGLYDLYKEFVNLKFNIFYSDKTKILKGIQGADSIVAAYSAILGNVHEELALKLFFTKEYEENVTYSLLVSELEFRKDIPNQELARVGLLILKGDQFEFIHRSFAEYFMSEHLIKKFDNEKVQKLLVEKILLKERYALIRKFFNGQLELFFKYKSEIELPGRQQLSELKHLEHAELNEEIKKSIADVLTKDEIVTVSHVAAEESHSAIIELLFDKLKGDKEILEALILATDPDGSTALHLAAKNDDTKSIKALLDSVKNDEKIFEDLMLATDCDENTALSCAVEFEHIKSVNALLDIVKNDKETIRDLVLKTNESGFTALHLADDHDTIVKALLDSVTDYKETFKELIMKPDEQGNTALHMACKADHSKTTKALLVSVMNDRETLKDLVLATNEDGYTALHLAAQQYCVEILKRTHLQRTALNWYTKIVKALLDSVKDEKETLKAMVLHCGNIDRSTALQFANKNDDKSVVHLLKTQYDDIASWLDPEINIVFSREELEVLEAHYTMEGRRDILEKIHDKMKGLEL